MFLNIGKSVEAPMTASPQKHNGLRDEHFNKSVGIADQKLPPRKTSNIVKSSVIQSRSLSVVQKNRVISTNNSVPSPFGIHTEKINIGHQVCLNGAYHQCIYILNALLLRRNVPLLHSINRSSVDTNPFCNRDIYVDGDESSMGHSM